VCRFSWSTRFRYSNVSKVAHDFDSLALHAAGVLHRDVKPENFVLTRNDDKTVVVIDFGLSKVYLNNSAHIEFKENKGMIGTARYASINALKGNE
jgi:serine/threonine protein kinase